MTAAIRWVLVALVAVTLGACRSRSGAASLGEVRVVEPFASMALPIGSGVVWSCNAAQIKIVYDGGSQAELGDAYDQAIRARGRLSEQSAATTPTEWLERYRAPRGTEVLTLEIHDADFKGKVPHGIEVFLSIRG